MTEVTDDSSREGNPLDAFQFGQMVPAVVLGSRRFGRKGRKGGFRDGGLELSLRPSAVAAAERGEKFDQRRSFGNVQEGDVVTGCAELPARGEPIAESGPASNSAGTGLAIGRILTVRSSRF